MIGPTTPAALLTIRAAVDRYVEVFEPKGLDVAQIEAAKAVLRRGDVVGVLADAANADAFANSLKGLWIAVRTEEMRVVFG